MMDDKNIGTEQTVEKTLLVRHLPASLSDVEKEELLFHFGASRVKVMSIKGPMKHAAFAMFPDQNSSEKALRRLHQLDVLGCRLSVEFSRTTQQRHFPSLLDSKRKEGPVKATGDMAEKEGKDGFTGDLPSNDGILKKWSVNYPRNPRIHYTYPLPSVSILTNIANALAAYPKFYVQVLHLMNKMNLPAPFSHVTPTPPIRVDEPQIVTQRPPDVAEMEQPSTEESEIESEGEAEKFISEIPSLKRPLSKKTKMPRKKPKLVQQVRIAPVPSSTPVLTPSEVFEEVQQPIHKKIQLKLPSQVSEDPQTELQKLGVFPEQAPPDLLSVVDPDSSTVVQGGFGMIEPVEKPVEKPEMLDSTVNYTVDPSKFVSREDLRKGRISEREMKNFPVFKNYQPGDPTSRLYIKNMAKSTSEQDLLNIFGQYVDWESEIDKNMFDIRLMKEGRMKGQAFITFPTDELARKAVRDSNSYVLHGKPMVVQFARSAKAKETADVKAGKKNR